MVETAKLRARRCFPKSDLSSIGWGSEGSTCGEEAVAAREKGQRGDPTAVPVLSHFVSAGNLPKTDYEQSSGGVKSL
jgi:hypothetical protein